MQVVLTKTIKSLGYEHDIVNVKRGYAANYLLPNGLAVMATPQAIARTETRRAERLQQLAELKEKAKETAHKIKDAVLKFTMKARGEKLYGSIADKDIVEAMKDQVKIELSKDMVHMKEPIKTVGSHSIKLHLADGVTTTVKIEIDAE